jgi:hypothetical protein
LGSRPDRARANDAAHPIQDSADPAEQGGFGTEDMHCSFVGDGSANVYASDIFGPPPDLMSMGDPGEAFGGS